MVSEQQPKHNNKKEKKTQKKKLPINPNWTQLQQKLKGHGFKPSTNEKTDTQSSILGKRKERPGTEYGDDSRTNSLDPINDDFSVTDVVAMDCEMVGVGQGTRSALGRVTLVNQWGNVIYDEFVRPIEWVVDFRTNISGIRPRDLKKAKDFPTVQEKVAALIKGRVLVGHALRNDLKALLLSHPKKDMRDTSEYQPFLGGHGRKALRHLAAEVLGVKIQNGEHCPIEDARAAMMLYQKNRKEWEKSAKSQRRLEQKQTRRKQRKKLKLDGTSNANHFPTSP